MQPCILPFTPALARHQLCQWGAKRMRTNNSAKVVIIHRCRRLGRKNANLYTYRVGTINRRRHAIIHRCRRLDERKNAVGMPLFIRSRRVVLKLLEETAMRQHPRHASGDPPRDSPAGVQPIKKTYARAEQSGVYFTLADVFFYRLGEGLGAGCGRVGKRDSERSDTI